MIGYKTREFWLVMAFNFALYGLSFAFLAPLNAPYVMSALASLFCYARGKSKANRAVKVGSALSEMIMCGITAALLAHLFYMHFIDRSDLWDGLAILVAGFTLSRGHGKSMTQAIKNHLPL